MCYAPAVTPLACPADAPSMALACCASPSFSLSSSICVTAHTYSHTRGSVVVKLRAADTAGSVHGYGTIQVRKR